MKNTEPPKRLRKEHRRCTQAQCGYFQQGFCQSCQKGNNCNARPYEINQSCTSCLNCEGKEGFLRWDDKNIENKDDEKIKIVLMKGDKPIAVIGEGNIVEKKPLRKQEDMIM